MTNPTQHSKEMMNPFFSHGVDIQHMRASGVLWIGGVVCSATEYTVRELRDPACHEMVSIV